MSQPVLKSIQGERQDTVAVTLYMDPADVDSYVDSANADVVICRERGRHDFPTIRETGMHFVDVDALGLHIRRVRCKCCKLVDLIEQWDIRHRGDTVTRAERASGRPDYSPRGRNGERYLGPAGRGRMTPKMVRGSVATGQLKGQSFKALRQEALAHRKK